MRRAWLPLVLVTVAGLTPASPLRAAPRPAAGPREPSPRALPSPSTRAGPSEGDAQPGRSFSHAPRAPGKTLAPLTLTSDRTQRLGFLLHSLDRGARHYRAWWIAWVTIYSVLTVGQGVAVAVAQETIVGRKERVASRRAYAIGAGASALGVIFAGIGYSPAIHGSAPVRALRDGTPEGDARALARAEATLRGAAAKQRFGRSWLVHAGGAAVNVAIALVLWLALEKPVNAGIQMGVGVAVSQTQIWTQPTQAARDWAAYRARFPDAAAALPTVMDPPRLTLAPYPGGAGLRVTW